MWKKSTLPLPPEVVLVGTVVHDGPLVVLFIYLSGDGHHSVSFNDCCIFSIYGLCLDAFLLFDVVPFPIATEGVRSVVIACHVLWF